MFRATRTANIIAVLRCSYGTTSQKCLHNTARASAKPKNTTHWTDYVADLAEGDKKTVRARKKAKAAPPYLNTLAPVAAPAPRRRSRKKNVPHDDLETTTLVSPKRKIPEVIHGNIREPHNVLQVLDWAYRRKGEQPVAGVRRVHITSESLCHDIIERLQPSLEKHKGCDILDLNPGVGVWSSKLHDFLKPRTHILMEQETVAYKPVLQPLLDKPGSTYRLVPASGLDWQKLEKVLSDEYLPHQIAFSKGDPRLHDSNSTLLVIANLGYYPKKPYRGFSSISQLILYQFMSAVKANSLFHRYGKIRMLVWTSDDERHILLPRAASGRRKAALELEICCPKSTEVSSSTSHSIKLQRDIRFEVDVIQQIMERMEKKGIKTPPGRESLLMAEMADRTSKHAVLGLQKARAEASKQIGDFLDSARSRGQKKGDQANRTKAFATKYRIDKVESMFKLVQQFEDIYRLEKDLFVTKGEDSPVRTQKLELLASRIAEREIGLAKYNKLQRQDLKVMSENSRVFEDRLLLWDRREYEPLRSLPDEFYPKKELALLDIQPGVHWPILSDPHNDEVLEYIISSVMQFPSHSAKKMITSLAPNAYEYLVENCPSLTDLTKGGSEDLDQLSARCISAQMYKEMVEAWAAWSWQPARIDILSKLGTSSFDEDIGGDKSNDDLDD